MFGQWLFLAVLAFGGISLVLLNASSAKSEHYELNGVSIHIDDREFPLDQYRGDTMEAEGTASGSRLTTVYLIPRQLLYPATLVALSSDPKLNKRIVAALNAVLPYQQKSFYLTCFALVDKVGRWLKIN